MVTYLKKPEGSEDFHQIETASTRILDNGKVEITVTIDGKVKIVIEASIRRHLKLEDSEGISNLPTNEIFEQLVLMSNMRRASKGYTGVDIPLFLTMLVQGLIFQGEGSTVLVESHHTPTADEAASTSVDVRHGGAATTVTSLDSRQGIGNIDKTPSMPYDSPLPRGHTLGSDEGRMQHNELMDLLIKKVKMLEKKDKLSKSRKARIVVSNDKEDLEDPSKQGRKIDETDQDLDISLVQHDTEFNFDFNVAKEVSTAKEYVSTAKPVSTAGATVTTANVVVTTASPTKVSTTEDITMAESLVYIRRSTAKTKDIGKGIMEEPESAMTKIKRQQEQERLGYEATVRLQAELEEEERQRIARVHESASSFNVEEWEDIKARVEADEELAQKLQVDEREKYYEVEQARMLNMGSYTLKQLRGYSFDEIKTLFETIMREVKTFVPIKSKVERAILELAAESSKRPAEEELDQESSKRQKTRESSESRDKEVDELSQEELQQIMIIVPENHTEVYQFFDDMLKEFDIDDLVMLWSLVKEKFNSTEPTDDKEREIWVELKRLFEPDTDDELWKLQKHIHDITWRLYDTCGVHHVSTKDGVDIYMLVEREYPLSRGVLTQMLVAKLLVEQKNEISRELLRKIFLQIERPRR
ncbi:hypothetical protein Tco_0218516 [Tanacetum coccineum]